MSLPAVAESALQNALSDFLRIQTQGLPGKVSFTIGQIDPRFQKTDCQSFEPFLPPGGRLWGRSTLGVRCLAPSAWTAYVQVQVSIIGNYLVSTQILEAGRVIAPSDVQVREGDLSALATSVLTAPEQAIGKTLKNRLTTGQILRKDQLLTAWLVQQGQTVRTIAQGSGFSISSSGRALNNGVGGQVIQIRTPSGQVVSGKVLADGVVDVSFGQEKAPR